MSDRRGRPRISSPAQVLGRLPPGARRGMADAQGAMRSGEQFTTTGRFALTARILVVNILPLVLLGGGLFYLDSYRTQLINERFKLARIEAQITAEALAGASRERQEALLVQIGKEQRMRLRMFDAEGRLWADSFALDEPAFQFDDITDDSWNQQFARWLDRTVDTIVSAEVQCGLSGNWNCCELRAQIEFFAEPDVGNACRQDLFRVVVQVGMDISMRVF